MTSQIILPTSLANCTINKVACQVSPTRNPPLVDMDSTLQTILGTILLFLFGLGIRNKFRIK
jgi:hypothetical protein